MFLNPPNFGPPEEIIMLEDEDDVFDEEESEILDFKTPAVPAKSADTRRKIEDLLEARRLREEFDDYLIK